jgi:hypothetical protein
MTDQLNDGAPDSAKPPYEPAEVIAYGKASALIETSPSTSHGGTDGGAIPDNYAS